MAGRGGRWSTCAREPTTGRAGPIGQVRRRPGPVSHHPPADPADRDGSVGPVGVLYYSDPRFLEHDTGPGHPERPARLHAVEAGIEATGVAEALTRVEPRLATRAEIETAHRAGLYDRVAAVVDAGGGHVDPDTVVSSGSLTAARLAVGAGLDAIERLDRGEADAAFCAVRPPGHHATPSPIDGLLPVQQRRRWRRRRSPARRAGAGRRLRRPPRQRHPGRLRTPTPGSPTSRSTSTPSTRAPVACGSRARGPGVGTTVNVPLPTGTCGDAYREALDEVVVPFAERFRPTWLLLSAGFDAHRRDPLTDLGLTAGDYADLTARLLGLVPPGRRLVFLEGGYDLEALAASAGAAVAALTGESFRPEHASEGDAGRSVVADRRRVPPAAGRRGRLGGLGRPGPGRCRRRRGRCRRGRRRRARGLIRTGTAAGIGSRADYGGPPWFPTVCCPCSSTPARSPSASRRPIVGSTWSAAWSATSSSAATLDRQRHRPHHRRPARRDPGPHGRLGRCRLAPG